MEKMFKNITRQEALEIVKILKKKDNKIIELEDEIAKKKGETKRIKNEYEDIIKRIKEEYEEGIKRIKEGYEEGIKRTKEEYEERIQRIKEDYEEKIKTIKVENEKMINIEKYIKGIKE